MENLKNTRLCLKDGTELDVKEFNADDLRVEITLLNLTYAKAVEALTQDQISDVKILNELSETVLTAKGYVLGECISVNSKEGTVQIALEAKETKEAVVEATKAIQSLQDTASQNTADIDAINEAIASLAEIVGGTAE